MLHPPRRPDQRHQMRYRRHQRGQPLAIFRFLISIFLAAIVIAHASDAAPDSAAIFDTATPVPVSISDSPAFDPAWKAILAASGIDYKMITVPHGRKRRSFIEGIILLDCCAAPEWRQLPDEQAIQLFSDSFHETEERYIFRTGDEMPIERPGQLRHLRVAVVRGFNYTLEDYFGVRVTGRDIDDVLNLIEMGRAHVGIISTTDFKLRMKKKPRNLTLGGINFRAALRIRVHNSHPELLPKINHAIATLKNNGRMQALVGNP